jgi:hypothetical protein
MTVTRMSTNRGTRIKRSLIQSDYITAMWTWFMILAAHAAEPVLVASVFSASVKSPDCPLSPAGDVVVFIAQFMALDIGGLRLKTLANQAMKDGNQDGAKQAKHLSLAFVAVLLIGFIMAGIDQIVKLDIHVGTVIDTVLFIARGAMKLTSI